MSSIDRNIELIDPMALYPPWPPGCNFSPPLSEVEINEYKEKLRRIRGREQYWSARRERDKSMVGLPLMGDKGFMLAIRGFIPQRGDPDNERIYETNRGYWLSITGQTTEGNFDAFRHKIEGKGIDLRNRNPSDNHFRNRLLTQQDWYFRRPDDKLVSVVGINYSPNGIPSEIFFLESLVPPDNLPRRKIYPKI
ncbi:MAG: hypothetical protein UU87_C0008G0004 [Parcubacteria group bacterium GW2011_GWA2_42_11]|nr:MAG: hypothetical protein UU87_C0008G0004 [Parcubacteria group bacterium GW2011_GWA2_42_11]